MKVKHISFIAIKEYDNLGIGYMSAVLSENGFKSNVIDFNSKKEDILATLEELQPIIIGFSVIYQYHIDKFTSLIAFLRNSGINSHLTAGGHYASLKYKELLELSPQLDSIVRFDGEYTILELAERIYSGSDWKETKSIAYRKNEKFVATPLRPVIFDLDTLPYPKRDPLPEFALDKKFATLIAGKGCNYNCSFCNLKEFFRQQNAPSKRLRNPAEVVKEMRYLYDEMDCSVFLFQDDDFPIHSPQQPDWTERFCTELQRFKLHDKIIWKINCRTDEIQEELFKLMKQCGLFHVFLGIEDGTDEGLKRLNKQLKVEINIKGIALLKKLNIGFDYGFLLFQPSTTFKSLYENFEFLRLICCDGYAPVNFLKLMPYYDTIVEKELLKEGRIKGKAGYRNYDFYSESLNQYFNFIFISFKIWRNDPNGLVNISKWCRDHFTVCHRFYRTLEVDDLHRRFLNIMAESNKFILDIMKESAQYFESGLYNENRAYQLELIRSEINVKHNIYKSEIHGIISDLKLIATIYQCLV